MKKFYKSHCTSGFKIQISNFAVIQKHNFKLWYFIPKFISFWYYFKVSYKAIDRQDLCKIKRILFSNGGNKDDRNLNVFLRNFPLK